MVKLFKSRTIEKKLKYISKKEIFKENRLVIEFERAESSVDSKPTLQHANIFSWPLREN